MIILYIDFTNGYFRLVRTITTTFGVTLKFSIRVITSYIQMKYNEPNCEYIFPSNIDINGLLRQLKVFRKYRYVNNRLDRFRMLLNAEKPTPYR